MIFPIRTVKVGKCVALFCGRGVLKGSPMLKHRPKAPYRGQRWQGSRLSFHLNKNRISRKSKTKLVLHMCDNMWCINPSHLYLGTYSDNIFDCYKRDKTRKAHLLGNKFALGYKHSQEIKDKISRLGMGNQNALGHKVSREARLKISNSKRQL